MEKNIEPIIISAIKDSLRELNFLLEDKELYLGFPQDSRFGDLSSNVALRLGSSLKKPPREIAAMILPILNKRIAGISLKECIKEIKVEGAGFINFYFFESYFFQQLKEVIFKGEDTFRVDTGKGKKVLIEFVSANPTGTLSVAHARQAAVGDALANVLSFLGYAVTREYYLNDEGNQINILGESVRLRIREMAGEKIDFPENYYQGDYIYEIAKEAVSKKIEDSRLKDFAADFILEIIKKELIDFGVSFDCWFSQKKLGASGKIEESLEWLKQKGFAYGSEGALWFKSTEFGDDKDRVVVKSDGSYTYLAPDIAYHQEKYRRGFDWLINFWGPDHHGYINRLKASVAAFGHNPDSLSVIIVQLATIFRGGKPVQMSTRKGQYITLREVLDEVGPDAARFFFLMRRESSHLDFDLDVAKKETNENPVYYIQYAYARICSILRQAGEMNGLKDIDFTLLKEKEEIELAKKICQVPYTLNICLITLDPYMLTVYLQELSEDFHKFYDLHRVLGSNQPLTRARLALLEATRKTISFGLGLLGVSQPEKM